MYRKWLLALGLPAFIASVGIVTVTLMFWPGMALYSAAGLWCIADWWIVSRSAPLISNASRIGLVLSLVVIFSIFPAIVFWPTPLVIIAEARLGNYVPGTDVAGIRWGDKASEIRLTFANNTSTTFSDVNVILHPELSILKIGFFQSDNACTVFPVGSPEMYVTTSEGQTVPAFPSNGSIAPRYRIHCDQIQPNSNVRTSIELVTLNPVINGILPRELIAAPRPPKWLTLKQSYTAHYRDHRAGETICFQIVGVGKEC
jgi:hypothetical protein